MADAVKKLFDDLLHPPELSRYADPYLANEEENTQLVPYHKDLAEGKTACSWQFRDPWWPLQELQVDYLVNRIVMPGPRLTET